MFLKIKPNELVDPVPQPVELFENSCQKFSKHSLYSKESNKINDEQFQLRMSEN